MDRLHTVGVSPFNFGGISARTQVVFLLNVGHHKEAQPHKHNQGPHDLQRQEAADLGLCFSGVRLIQRLPFPVCTASRYPNAQDADEHATGQEQESKDEALGKLAALSTDEGLVRVLEASPLPLPQMQACPGAGQNHSAEPNHCARWASNLEHHVAV